MIKFNKRAFAFAAAAMIVLSSTVALAERTTTPASNQGTVTIEQPQASQTAAPAAAQTTETDGDNTTQTSPAVSIPTPVAVTQEQNVVETGQNQKEMERKYASKGFVILWFFLLLIINAVISFAIANRFYKLARKENHIAAEVRALRRDLESKFVQSVDAASEMETDVTNTNENYSKEGSVEDIAASSFAKESEDIFRQWETKMARRAAKAAQVETEENDAEIIEEEYDEPKRIKKYQPVRDNDADADSENALKSKAKEFIGTIFPFKD